MLPFTWLSGWSLVGWCIEVCNAQNCFVLRQTVRTCGAIRSWLTTAAAVVIVVVLRYALVAVVNLSFRGSDAVRLHRGGASVPLAKASVSALRDLTTLECCTGGGTSPTIIVPSVPNPGGVLVLVLVLSLIHI